MPIIIRLKSYPVHNPVRHGIAYIRYKQTDRRTTTMPIARPLQSAKNVTLKTGKNSIGLCRNRHNTYTVPGAAYPRPILIIG